MEKRLLEQQQEVALEGYESLRRQHEEVMMLRHDMLRHFHTLQEMSSEEKVSDYLTDLIGQNEKIRTVVQSGNEMLDIMLNGKLTAAMDAGIKVEIVKAEAPEKLPLRDADLCSLVMNILDNALAAASDKEVLEPFIRLNIHVKGNFLAIVCENAANMKKLKQETKQRMSSHPYVKETVPKHGLGLKIIRSIIERYDGGIGMNYDVNYYRIRVILPLS